MEEERRAARERVRARRAARRAGQARPERVTAFSVEEFEAHHARGRGEDTVAEPAHGSRASSEASGSAGAGAAEPIEVEAVETEVVIVEPAPGVAVPADLPRPDPADVGPPVSIDPSLPPSIEDERFDEEAAGDVIHFDDPGEVLPALARVAAELWVRAAIWGLETSLRTGTRVARATVDPQAATELYQDVAGGLRAYAREFLGISDLDDRLRQLTPLAGATLPQNGENPEITLRERGARLLREAADVNYEDGVHPAYARILTELAPDEARILRTLATEGPQPMVDIRETNLIGMGSQLIAAGLNMIGAQAGLRHRDSVEAYLGNLLRLGLIELSDAALDDAIAYQVLEAQPEVLDTIKETPRAKSLHRSIRLTPFGEGFCRVCLPLESASGGDPLGQQAQTDSRS